MTQWKLIGSGVDWITATCSKGGEVSGFLTHGARFLEAEKANGNPAHPANFNGYHGSSSLHTFVGYRKDGACVRLGGPVARLGWRTLARLATNVTRLDLAVTATSDPVAGTYAADQWHKLSRRTSAAPSACEYSCIQSTRGGASLYCGRRTSPAYGRIYDKHSESGGLYPAGSWRWEVEFKADLVRDVTAILHARAREDLAVCWIVAQRFYGWGIQTPWHAESLRLEPHDDRGRSTVESRMKWLREGVSPSLDVLKGYYSGREILRALNLTAEVQPSDREWADSLLITEIEELLR